MRIVYMGTPDFAVPAFEALADAHEVAAVYTQPPRPAGRGQKDRPSAVHAAAAERGIEVRTPASLKNAEAQAVFHDLQADVAVVAAYGLILPKPILDAPRRGCLNIHASLLPRWRGAAPIHRAILAGDDTTGVCIMRMEEGLDTGPVLDRRHVRIGPRETTGDLHDRLAILGAEAVVAVLDDLDNLVPEPQPEDGVTYATKIDKAEARIDWYGAAEDVDRQIRGLSPLPGAWTTLAGKRLKVLRSHLADTGTGRPGEVLRSLTVACGAGAVVLDEVQIEGRGRQDQDAFLRGTKVEPGTILGDDA